MLLCNIKPSTEFLKLTRDSSKIWMLWPLHWTLWSQVSNWRSYSSSCILSYNIYTIRLQIEGHIFQVASWDECQCTCILVLMHTWTFINNWLELLKGGLATTIPWDSMFKKVITLHFVLWLIYGKNINWSQQSSRRPMLGRHTHNHTMLHCQFQAFKLEFTFISRSSVGLGYLKTHALLRIFYLLIFLCKTPYRRSFKSCLCQNLKTTRLGKHSAFANPTRLAPTCT